MSFLHIGYSVEFLKLIQAVCSEIDVVANNLPVITPNDPPATKIAAGDNLPLEFFKVFSAPAICKKAFPKHNSIKVINILVLVNPYNRYDINNNIVPINPIFILGYLSDTYPIKL